MRVGKFGWREAGRSWVVGQRQQHCITLFLLNNINVELSSYKFAQVLLFISQHNTTLCIALVAFTIFAVWCRTKCVDVQKGHI